MIEQFIDLVICISFMFAFFGLCALFNGLFQFIWSLPDRWREGNE